MRDVKKLKPRSKVQGRLEFHYADFQKLVKPKMRKGPSTRGRGPAKTARGKARSKGGRGHSGRRSGRGRRQRGRK